MSTEVAAARAAVIPVSETPKNRRQKASATSGNKDNKNQPKKSKCKLKLHVSNLPAGTTKQNLKDVFKEFGPITVEALAARFATVVCGNPKKRDDALEKEFIMNDTKLVVQPEKPFGSRHTNQHQLPHPLELDLGGDPVTQLRNFLSAVRLQQEHLLNIMNVIIDVETSLRPEFEECEATPFGSLCTGLGILGSDADCFVQLKNCPDSDQRNIVNRAHRQLRRKPHVFADVIAISQAHTPIVKLFHRGTGTPCDVTFKTRLGIRNSALVAALFSRDARFMHAAVVLKYWAGVHGLTGPGKLSNYALTMLIIFFLQHLKLLPSIAEMQARTEPDIVDGWNTAFEEPTPTTPPEDGHTVHSLVGEFCGFYSEYDIDTLAVCPYIGRPIKKSAFNKTEELPKEFERYRENVTSGASRPLRHRRPLVVQDPFEQCQNVAAGIVTKQSLWMCDILANSYECYLKFGESEKFLPRLFSKAVIPSEPIKMKFHPECKVSIDVGELVDSGGWMERTIEASKFVLEHCLLLSLEKLSDKVEPEKRSEKYSAVIECPLWERSGVDREGAELVARERRVSQLVAARAAEAGGGAAGEGAAAPVWMLVSLDVRTWQGPTGRGAALLAHLSEGHPYYFQAWSSFLTETVADWIKEVLHKPRESGWDVEPLH